MMIPMSRISHSAASAALPAQRPLWAAGGATPPVLLTMPGYHGTLAAIRNLGRNGIAVTTADPARFTMGSCSKYAREHVRCPPVRRSELFVEWLLTFGRSREPHVLLPTCDDTAFLYSLHRAALSKHFYLGLPDVTVLHALLNKRLLREHAAAVGLATPQSWMPSSLAEVEQVAREARFPLLVKPTTQVLFDPRVKGTLVLERNELVRTYKRVSGEAFGRELRDYDASVTRPIIQEFFTDAAATGIYSICGHVRSGRIVGSRSMRKVLQWPRRLGIGVCFEAAEPREDLLQGLEHLTRRVGFNGTFEAEFVQDGPRRLLIDFNPRFYSQMGFDIARGLPLPLLAYRDAIGQPYEPPAASAAQNGAAGVTAYAHGAALGLLLGSQRLSGALTPAEWQKWRSWRDVQGQVDAVMDPDDPVPAYFDKMNIARDALRHPLRFVNVIALNRT
jgi:D-aspartate ligase